MTGEKKTTSFVNVVSEGNVRVAGAGNELWTIAFIQIGAFLFFCVCATLFTQALADPGFLLGVIIDVSSVMVGFAGITAIFLVQTALKPNGTQPPNTLHSA